MSSPSLELSKEFPFSPARPSAPLPFEIDEMDFSKWFNSLAKLDNFQKSLKIFDVLQTLNNSYPANFNQIPGRTRLFFLEKLGSALDTATAMLTHLPVTIENVDSSPNLADNDNAKNELSVWSNLELGNAYLLLTQEEWFHNETYFSLKEKTLIIANGMQAMSRALLYIFQAYFIANANFWPQCYQFYSIARNTHLLEVELNPEAVRIENEFKRLLVFALSNTNQFSPQEMRTIYELLGLYAIHASLLKTVPKKKFQGIPVLSLRSNQPPRVTNDEVSAELYDCLYVATVNVASKILEATYDRRSHHLPADRLMLLRLAKTLTLNKQRKSDRSTAKGNQIGMMGFDHVVDFLNEKESENESVIAIEQSQPLVPGELRDFDFEIDGLDSKQDIGTGNDFSLEKLNPHAFQIVEFTDPSTIWQPTEKPNNLKINMRLLDKSSSGFGLLWTDSKIKPKVGTILGILHKSLTVCLVRWLAQSKETGMFMGVEILGFNAATVKMSNPGFPDLHVPALYLPGGDAIKEYASLILMNQKDFQPDEFIFLNKHHKNIRYRQTKQLHLTTFINHIEVVRSF